MIRQLALTLAAALLAACSTLDVSGVACDVAEDDCVERCRDVGMMDCIDACRSQGDACRAG